MTRCRPASNWTSRRSSNDLKADGVSARGSADVAELVRLVAAEAQSGDLVLVMSNGAFGGFIPSLMTALGSGGGKP